jgi:hypothetical protein
MTDVRFNPRQKIGNWLLPMYIGLQRKVMKEFIASPFTNEMEKNVFISYPNEPGFGVYTYFNKKIYKINLKP